MILVSSKRLHGQIRTKREPKTQHSTSLIFSAEGISSFKFSPFFISKGVLATSQGLVKEKALSSTKQSTDLKMG